MNRRNFLKTTSAVTAALLLPGNAEAAPVDFTQVQFDETVYNTNNAQTIIVFLYGGPSMLGANLTNYDEIALNSQSDYNYFEGRMHITENTLWQEAGGTFMEEMLANGDMNLFRTCYSQLREDDNNKSHGRCVSQNQRGVMNDGDSTGIASLIAKTLFEKGVIDSNTKLPVISMEGESTFFTAPDFTLESFLKPTALTSDLSNPYARRDENQWMYYTDDERAANPDNYRDNRAALDIAMDTLAQSKNNSGKIKENFDKRVELDTFINEINDAPLREGVVYPDNSFAERLKSAIKIMVKNPDTKIISLGSSGVGGWDDHNEARDYPTRMETLMGSISAAMSHLKAEGKEGNINIMVWGDFGRNVNLNSSQGWDHGNLQNFYLFGGKNYFNQVGIVGETELEATGAINRLYLKPKAGSYRFEPACIAATLYKIYGITNPEHLTNPENLPGDFGPIESGLLS